MGLGQILKSFQRPAWKHRKPEIRKQAVQQMSAYARSLLLEVARDDPDPDVRCAAITRLVNLSDLQGFFDAQPTSIRACARQRFTELLCGKDPAGPSLDECRRTLDQCNDEPLIELLARQAVDPALRRHAILQLEREAVLGDIALTDAAVENRVAAAERLNKTSTLRRVAKLSRNKDKRVFRVVRAKLDALREQEELPKRMRAEAERLLDELARVRDHGLAGQAVLGKCQRRWPQLQNHVDEQTLERYRTLLSQAEGAMTQAQAQQSLHEEKKRILTDVEALLSDLQHQRTSRGESSITLDQHVEELQGRWQALEPLEDAAAEDALQQHLARLTQAIDAFRVQAADLERVQQKRLALCERAETLLRDNAVLKHTAVARLKEAWQSLGESVAADPLAPRFRSAQDALRARLEQQQRQADTYLQELPACLEALEAAVAEGASERARELFKQAQTQYEHIEQTMPRQLHKLRRAYQRARAKISELQGWQTWASTQQRRQLIQQAEALTDYSGDPDFLAHQIRELRNAWKAVPGRSRTTDWERFNQACNTAYGICQTHFENQAVRRQQNLDLKTRLCEQLEDYVARMDWTPRANSPVDWRLVEQTMAMAKRQWQDIGAVPHAQHKPIEQRFNACTNQIYNALKGEWNRNVKIKEGLLQQARDAVQQAEQDPRAAAETIKDLQQQWRQTEFAGRRFEGKLRKAFQAACDQVFNCRQQQSTEFRQQLQDNLRQAKELCQALQDLLASDAQSWHELQGQYAALQERWQGLGDLPKDQRHTIQQTYRDACRKLERRRRELARQQEQRELDLLREKAALCAAIETLSETGEPLDELCAQWQRLPSLNDEMEAHIRRRYEAACQNSGQLDQAVLAANQARLEQLCLRMEILGGRESPAEAVAARMDLQVARLEAALSERRGDLQPADEYREILQQWYVTGPLTEPVRSALQHRFELACTHYLRQQADRSHGG